MNKNRPQLTTDDPRVRNIDRVNFDLTALKGPRREWSLEELNAVLVDAEATGTTRLIKDAHFQGLRLSGTRFSRVEFENCGFSGCSLVASEFADAKFYNTIFYKCSLMHARMQGNFFQHISLIDCELDSTRFSGSVFVDSVLKNIKSSYTNIDNVLFTNGSLEGNSFTLASAEGTKFHRVSTFNTWFNASDITNAHFDGCNLQRLTFDATDLSTSVFHDCSFNVGGLTNSSATETKFSSCSFTGTSFDNSFLNRCSFDYCKASDFRCLKTRMVKCRFDESKIDGSIDFYLFGCDFSHASITAQGSYSTGKVCKPWNFLPLSESTHGRYQYALVGPRVDLSGRKIGFKSSPIDLTTVLDGADLSKSDICNAAFRFASLKDANFSQAKITQVDFSGADLTGADLSGAWFYRRHETLLAASNKEFLVANSFKNLVPVIYDSATKWPDGFTPPETMATSDEIEIARRHQGDAFKQVDSTTEGLVFIPSPHERNSFTFLFAVFPDLFEVYGRFAIASTTAAVTVAVMREFANSVRKDDSGNKLTDFQQKLDFTLAAMSESLSASVIRAHVETSPDPTRVLLKMIALHVTARRRAHSYAAKKETAP